MQPRETRVERLAIATGLLRTIEQEYAEMPGMRLTEAQFRRLWALDAAECQRITTTLLTQGVLTRDAGGRYCRRVDLD